MCRKNKHSDYTSRARKILSTLAALLQDCTADKDFNTLGYISQDIRALLDSVEAYNDYGYNY